MKRVLVIGVVLALLGAGQASALEYEVRIPRSEAIAMVKRSGGAVHSCKRLAPRRFQCIATYWKIEHTAEEVEPGRWEEVSAVPVSEELLVLVTLSGVHPLRPV